MKFAAVALALLAGTSLGTAFADEGPSPHGVGPLNHVFYIMMENHGYAEVLGNPDMPWLNTVEIPNANLATNYFAVAHPSQTNYLEAIGGSNFGILNDNTSNFGSTTCVSTLTPAGATDESSAGKGTPLNCPIAGTGVDTATPLIDYSNETSGPPGDIEIDGVHSYKSASTVGKSIGDQLNAVNLTWKTYQESLPSTGAWGVTTADGQFTNIATPTADELAQGETYGKIGKLYRMKHNPFAAFASVQAGYDPTTGKMPGIASYEGTDGLWADLATGKVPNFSFIVPNQCHDQHGGTSSGLSYPWCTGDSPGGLQSGTNAGLMQSGDIALKDIVTAIKASPAWKKGRNAIVITWDENDYTTAPITNQVVTVVDTNYGSHGMTSGKFYTHFSLLKSIESGFGLPCLNHACDASTAVMSDLFH